MTIFFKKRKNEYDFSQNGKFLRCYLEYKELGRFIRIFQNYSANSRFTT